MAGPVCPSSTAGSMANRRAVSTGSMRHRGLEADGLKWGLHEMMGQCREEPVPITSKPHNVLNV